MAGLLSSMFHPEKGSDHHPADPHGADHHGQGTDHYGGDHIDHASHDTHPGEEHASGSSGEHSIGGHADPSPTVSFHSETGGSYDAMDGSTHSWSNSQDVSATADTEAVFGATQSYQTDSMEG